MSKKIFAIGGGKEFEIYREMLRFADIKNPQVLVIPHAQALNKQQGNYDRMYNILAQGFGCNISILKSDELANINKTKEMLDKADIIYVCEGNTVLMINTWKQYNFDELLKEELEKGKLLAGTSAGAVCWFNSFTSEIDGKLSEEHGLNFVDAYLTCHGQKENMYDFHKEALKENSKLGILLTNKSAIEIIDEKCKIITSNHNSFRSLFYDDEDKKTYAIISYFENDEYYEKIIYDISELEDLNKSLTLKLK